jgi:CBS domain-containing protein
MTGRRVAEVMLRAPIVLAATDPVAEARAVLGSSHVHMVLLTASGRVGDPLLGTLVRDDLPAPGRCDGDSALAHARLVGRTVGADVTAEDARRAMRTAGTRRLAVVDHTGRLLGLLCLKRSGEGFCTDAGVQSRRAARASDATAGFS